MRMRIAALVLAMIFAVQCVSFAAGNDEKKDRAQFTAVETQMTLDELFRSESMAVETNSEQVKIIVVLDEGLLADGWDEGSDVRRQDAAAQQEAVLERIRTLLGDSTLAPNFSYALTVNGFSCEVPGEYVDKIRSLEGVEEVRPAASFSRPMAVELSAAEPVGAILPNDMVGVNGALDLGYVGVGKVAAVIDTGIDGDHPAFSVEPDESHAALSKAEIASLLSGLNAAGMMEGLTADDVYLSGKIPFAFNYADCTPDVGHSADEADDHGTHVAGVLAADSWDGAQMTGIAPKAQLLVMKVFGQAGEDATEDALLAAVEDAVALGADVINLSLGSLSGFSYEDTVLADAIQCAVDSGVAVCAAVGNEGSSTVGNASGIDLGSTANVDVGLVCSPASLDGVLSVASVECGISWAFGVLVSDGGENVFVPYTDTGLLYGIQEFRELTEQYSELEYICVPGVGCESDYEGLDAAGKIAVVSRGEITFAEKSNNAFCAGAVGVVVYNNVDEPAAMDLTGVLEENRIPCVMVEMEQGELLVRLAGVDGLGTVFLTGELGLVRTEDSGRLNAFSSWGAGSDLSLKPEYSAVGGTVLSAMDGGVYGYMSGTSMATPQLSGAILLLTAHVENSFGYTGKLGVNLAQTLLMNTAVPALQSDGVEYSPRKQGGGLIAIDRALDTDVYLTVEGSVLPKAELGDDPGRTGVYDFRVTLNNLSGEDRSFAVDASVLTECAQSGYMLQWARQAEHSLTVVNLTGTGRLLYDFDGNGEVGPEDVPLFAEQLGCLSGAYDLTGDGITDRQDVDFMGTALSDGADLLDRVVVEVPARGHTELYIRISLTQEEKSVIDGIYEHGIYIDGYVYLENVEGGTDLSLPLLAYYGDWSEMPLFQTTTYAESQTENWTGEGGDLPVSFRVMTGASGWLGMNPVAADIEYLPERSNGLNLSGGEGGALTDIYFDLMRNAASITVEVTTDGGEVLYHHTGYEIIKSCCYDELGTMAAAPWTMEDPEFRFEPAEYGLADGMGLTIRIIGQKDGGGRFAREVIEIPVYLDGTAPKLLEVVAEREECLEDGCTVTLTACDSRYLAGVLVLTPDGRELVGSWVVDQTEAGSEVEVVLDLTEQIGALGGQFRVALVDYAQNVALYDINVLEEGETTLLDKETMFAFGTKETGMGWYKLDLMGRGIVTEGFRNYLGTVCAAEMVGDRLFAVCNDGENRLYSINTATYLGQEIFALGLDPWDEVLDMAWCQADGCMYLLVWDWYGYVLLKADCTGERVTQVCEYRGDFGYSGLYGLTCTGDGDLCVVAGKETEAGETALFCTVDCQSGHLEPVCVLDVPLNNSVVSAATDPATGGIYFTRYLSVPDYEQGVIAEERSDLFCWMPGQQECELVRELGETCMDVLVITGWASDAGFDPEDDMTDLVLTQKEIHILPSHWTVLGVSEFRPWYIDGKDYELIWTSSDSGVACVDKTGRITGVRPGTADITVTAVRDGGSSVSSVCRVVVEEDPVFCALGSDGWYSTVGFRSDPEEMASQLTCDASAAAYGVGGGAEGRDVIYVLSRGLTPTGYVLYTYDAENMTLLSRTVVGDRLSFLGYEIPENGFSDLVYDACTGELIAVAGYSCYFIDPDKGAFTHICSVPGVNDPLTGIAIDRDGTCWLVDSAGKLYRAEGRMGDVVSAEFAADLGLSTLKSGVTAMEYDWLRNVMWVICGRSMYRLELNDNVLCPVWEWNLPENSSVVYMKGF